MTIGQFIVLAVFGTPGFLLLCTFIFAIRYENAKYDWPEATMLVLCILGILATFLVK